MTSVMLVARRQAFGLFDKARIRGTALNTRGNIKNCDQWKRRADTEDQLKFYFTTAEFWLIKPEATSNERVRQLVYEFRIFLHATTCIYINDAPNKFHPTTGFAFAN